MKILVSDEFLYFSNNWGRKDMVSLPGNTPYMSLWLCMQVILGQSIYPEMFLHVSSVPIPISRIFHCDLADIYQNICEISPAFLLTLIEQVLQSL